MACRVIWARLMERVSVLLGKVDEKLTGTVSWGAWPKANQQKMTTDEDVLYKNVLGSKNYMMGVSPYFYTSKSPLS